MVLAALLLLPFLNTPFTIDDPIYLREAQHVLADPLHPQAFNMVWSTDLDLRASQILPGGIAAPYLLIPTALAGCAEWVGHLTQLVLLFAALIAIALMALRLGLDRRQARLTTLLTAACPAVLGMAGTVMPDIPAMLFVVLGMERIAAWRDGHKWPQALLAIVWLALAALTRAHTILVLAAAFVLLLDGIGADEIRASFRRFPARFLPILLTPVVYLLVSALTADPEHGGKNIVGSMMMADSSQMVIRNGLAFLAHWLLVVPFTIPWLVLRFRRVAVAMVTVIPGTALLVAHPRPVAAAAAATFVALADVLWDAVRRRDRVQLALWLWLFPALPVAVYFHLPSKYLLLSVPAAVMLVIRLIPQSRPETVRWLVPSAAIAGAVLGLLILLGIRDLAEIQRHAVAELIEPRVKLGEHVWFAGHWGFQWYAELAGARPVTQLPPLPRRGDIVVVSKIDSPVFARLWTGPRKTLRHLSYTSGGLGRIMDFRARAGFFSSPFGYLPWIWGPGRASLFEVWEVE